LKETYKQVCIVDIQVRGTTCIIADIPEDKGSRIFEIVDKDTLEYNLVDSKDKSK